jgi:DHA2 family multidrug resistance protein
MAEEPPGLTESRPAAPLDSVQAPMVGMALGVTAFALAMGTFMQVLDSTIANVSLPTIAGNLGASAEQGTWVVTSFVVANGIGVPLTGWLMGRYGIVRTFIASVLGFTIASLLCGLAWNLDSLIIFRVLQGSVSGPMIPGSQALLISIFPANRRATALGIWSITALVAPICGPLLGGYISDNFHWGWIFLINVPVGFVATLLCWTNLRGRETPTRQLPVDMVGLGLLVVWTGALQILLDTGKNADWFHSTQIVILAIISAISFTLFIIWELTDDHPIVDLSLFRKRNFFLGTVAFCVGNAMFFANMLLMQLWMQTQLGFTPTWAGLIATPTGIVAILLTPLAVWMVAKMDSRVIAAIAFVASAVSYFMRARLTADSTLLDIALPFMVHGIAMATFFIAMTTIILDGINPRDIPMASGLSNFLRIIAASFAASLVTTVWDWREAFHQSRMVEMINIYGPTLDGMLKKMQALGLSEDASNATIAHSLTNQAYLLAANDIFYVSGWLYLILIILVWLCRRPKSGNAPVALD